MPTVGLSLDDWLARLETFSPHEIDLGLERVEAVLARLALELPETLFHVAGTNGKGSSVAMLESILLAADTRVGSYTSPHMQRYNERIRLGGVDASDEQIVAAFERVEAARDDTSLTYFEFGTLAALVVFANADVDTAILEVGMGGRLDAVNALEPSACLITNVALDHCAWLGNDIETIALEKAGIMRPHMPVVFASRQRPASIDSYALDIDANLIAAGRDYQWTDGDEYWSWQGARYRFDHLRVPSLPGAMQIQNAAGVLALIEATGLDNLLITDLVNGAFGNVELAGRMQSEYADGNWLFDVAHNPAAAAALRDTLQTMPDTGKTIAVVGVLDDKDVEGIVSELADQVDAWLAVTASGPRALPARELSRRVANTAHKGCLIADSIPEALEHARALADPEDRILVTGSFYVVGPVLSALDIYSPR